MEFLEDNPNLEINLQNDEENKKINRKIFKKIKLRGISPKINSLKNSLKKEDNQNNVMYNVNEKHNINIINTPNHTFNKDISSIITITKSPSKSSKSSHLLNILKIQKTQRINHILEGLKTKNNYHLSPNTNLKLYGDLFPGPGQYYNPKVKIGQNQNIRYNNLYTKETEPNLSLKYKMIKDLYYNSKVGPGTYDPNNNIVYKSYSQNPKIFISQLERGPLFKINDNTIGPGQYNLIKDYKKDIKFTSTNQFKKRNNNLNINTGTQFAERNIQILNTFNNNNYESILNTSNSLNISREKLEEKKNRGSSGKNHFRAHQNFSWKGVPDFSGISIKYNENDNKNIENDIINYKKQNFNFENQFKLNQDKKDISQDTSKQLQKEISGYNKLYMPLIQNVQRDLSLKGNHIPGPCYYKYVNDSIEGDMVKLNKRIKNSAYKKWK